LVGAESAIDDPEARIPHSAAMEMLDVLVRGMRDRSIGLKAAQRVVPSNFDVLEYAGLSSGTVREAIETTNRYVRLMHDAADFFLEEREGVARWVLRMSQGVVLTAPAVDFVAGVLAVVAPRLVGRAIDFRRINFRHSPPVDTTSYEELFGCPVRFDADDDALEFAQASLDFVMPRADPGLKALLDRTAEQLLDRLPRSNTWSERVREVMASELASGSTGIEAVAERLRMTPRTLRRRLREENTTHTALLDELRRGLAMHYLGERRLSVGEVAFLLGFAEPSSFHKAFKRWTGTSPMDYRRAGRR
jgi:AraC-like DNA-binding protein